MFQVRETGRKVSMYDEKKKQNLNHSKSEKQ